MADYIKREDAINQAIEAVDEWDCGYITSREDMIRIYLNDIPAADVRENVRGEWSINGQTAYTCSNCGIIFTFGNSYRFCPWCGADMRGGEKDG